MHLSSETLNKIKEAHFVRGISPENYLVPYKNIYELLLHQSSVRSGSDFITFYPDEGEAISLTYGEFRERVLKTVNFLISCSVSYGDRVATVSHNHINTVIQYFAVWSLGAVVVPINVNEEPERISYIMKHSGAKLVFVHHLYADKIRDLNIKDIKCVLHGKYTEGFFECKISDFPVKQITTENVNHESEALLVYTSGTTGIPKGVVLTQYNLMVDAYAIQKWHKISSDECMMCVLPIHHVNGTVVTLMTPMYSGARVILNQKFHTDRFFEIIKKENVQIVSVVPTLLQYLCHDYESGRIKKPELKSFRHIICGAGPLTCELAAKFESLFGLNIIHGYGLSETTCYSCFCPVDLSESEHKKWMNDYGFPSIGVEIETNEMDIQNEHGESLGENVRGEIVIRGHNVMKYYDASDEVNLKTFEHGWFRSGDEGFYLKDDSGRKFFFITGRIKELIIRGGVNISPLEIDEVLMSLPEVKSGIAVGFENDWYGEEIGALIIPNVSFEINDELKVSIIQKCRERLPFHKTPKVVVFSDSIPVTS
ncbi:MAG: acyl--CoA ligase, partial [Ignavibacteria bacterium]|nr:acyl--CoA ligase [Ignavibacteria bacterium]